MTLRTRKPTGEVAYPLLLVEGGEKTGKTYAALSLSADPRIGRSFLFDFGEGSGDEYGPLGPFEIVEHNGTFSDFIDQLEAACAAPMLDGKPNLIVIDSITGLWDALKVWTEGRARASRKGQRILAEDPDAEVDVSMNLWTDATGRWGRMISILRGWPGVAVLIARGRDVAMVGANGAPVSGQTEYKVDAQKSTPFVVSAQVRMTAPHRATLVAVRSLSVDLPGRGLDLPDDAPLAHAVFDVLGAGAEWQVSSAVVPQFGRMVRDAKRQLVAIFAEEGDDDQTAKDRAAGVWLSSECADLAKDAEVSDAQWADLLACASVALDDDVTDGAE